MLGKDITKSRKLTIVKNPASGNEIGVGYSSGQFAPSEDFTRAMSELKAGFCGPCQRLIACLTA